MKYILSDQAALRSWHLIPHACYVKGEKYVRGLTRDEFFHLLRCDGKQELAEDEVLKKLLEEKLCRPAENGETLSEWQRLHLYTNRYFPKLFWSITEKCSCHCLHCYNAAGNADGRSEFTREESLRLIREAKECGIRSVKLTGGEPFLHPCFSEIVREIQANGMQVERIYTGGDHLTQDVLREIRKAGSSPVMKISLDGLGAHGWLHGDDHAEETALRAIRLCIRNGFHVQVVMNLHRKNFDTLLPTALKMSEMGADALQVLRTTESPRVKLCRENLSLEPEEYYDGLLAFTAEYLKSGAAMPVEIWKFLNLDPKTVRETVRRESRPEDMINGSDLRCSDNRSIVTVAADGELYPCITMTGLLRRAGKSYGNVKKSGLKALLTEGPYLDEICSTLEKFREENKECASCEYFGQCAGGCPAMALAMTGDMHKKSRLQCVFYKGHYPDKIRETVLSSLKTSGKTV